MKTFLTIMLLSTVSIAQESLKQWEKLGITSKEWHECQLRNFSDDSIKIIVSYGIMPSEFFQSPWLAHNLTCEQWLTKRKSGMTDEQIFKTVQAIEAVKGSKTVIEMNDKQISENLLKFESFILPGYLQITSSSKSQKIQGSIMGTIFVASIAGTIAWSIKEDCMMPTSLVTITLPVMLWSYFNFKRSI